MHCLHVPLQKAGGTGGRATALRGWCPLGGVGLPALRGKPALRASRLPVLPCSLSRLLVLVLSLKVGSSLLSLVLALSRQKGCARMGPGR